MAERVELLTDEQRAFLWSMCEQTGKTEPVPGELLADPVRCNVDYALVARLLAVEAELAEAWHEVFVLTNSDDHRILQLEGEVVRLRAAALPDGGKWVTEYGHSNGRLEPQYWDSHRCARVTCVQVQRRVWYGPPGPVEGARDA